MTEADVLRLIEEWHEQPPPAHIQTRMRELIREWLAEEQASIVSRLERLERAMTEE